MNRLLAAATAAILVLQPLAAFAGCSVFEHRDYQGAEWYLDSGETLMGVNYDPYGCDPSYTICATMYLEPSWNDVISSFRVDRGCHIEMWGNIARGGALWTSSKSYKYVGGDWNDAVSEVYCYCD